MSEYEAVRAIRFQEHTLIPDILFDEIIPEVTRACPQGQTAGLIMFRMETKAAEDHSDSADLSIADLAEYINEPLSEVILAQNWLVLHGYIEVIVDGKKTRLRRVAK